MVVVYQRTWWAECSLRRQLRGICLNSTSDIHFEEVLLIVFAFQEVKVWYWDLFAHAFREVKKIVYHPDTDVTDLGTYRFMAT